MKILLVSPYVPHPRCGHGTGVMVYGMIEHLMRRHEVTLVSFCDAKEALLAEDLKHLPLKSHFVPREKGEQSTLAANAFILLRRFWQMFVSVVLWEPYYVSKYRDGEMSRLIGRLTTEEEFDVIEFEMAQMGRYAASAGRRPKILHEHDFTFRPAYRNYRHGPVGLHKMAAYVEFCRWASYEKKMAKEFDRMICVTGQDVALMKRLFPSSPVSYLPRGIALPENKGPAAAREPRTLLFVGSFSHAPNADAAEWLVGEIFPRVAERFPGTILYIVGGDPPAGVTAAAAHDSRIRVTGFVDELDAYYRKATLLVAPLRFGGGIKMKILQAFAFGIPVVTTKVGIEGIEGVRAGTIPVGDTAAAIAGQVCRLFEEPAAATVAGAAGIEIIRNNYSWQKVTGDLENIYSDVIARGTK